MTKRKRAGVEAPEAKIKRLVGDDKQCRMCATTDCGKCFRLNNAQT